tara:strand:- start:908 stop:1447 length:540 start_codon:yes stop_codon:yes gene_type:complete
MKIPDNNIQDYMGTNFLVYKREDGGTVIKYKTSGDIIENSEMYSKVMLGKCETCNPFFKNSFDGFSYDKVLVVGLGLGLIAQELSEVNNCSTIDVLEIDQEIIDYTISSGHLNSDINLIQGDIYNYTTEETYDLIILDIIWYEHEMSNEDYELLKSRLLPNINTGGALYVPILKKFSYK